LLLHHNALLRGLNAPSGVRAAAAVAAGHRAKVLPSPTSSGNRLDEARRAGKRILFEGAQGVMLDVDHGTYPTSPRRTRSRPGRRRRRHRPGDGRYVLGITKAYTTRVGSGPFPTELTDKTGALLGERGKEFGVVTGRKRRCGWFDAVMVRQAVKVAGSPASPSPSSTCSTAFPRSRCAPPIAGAARRCIICRRARPPRPSSSRFTRRGGVEREHARRALMGAAQRARDQNIRRIED